MGIFLKGEYMSNAISIFMTHKQRRQNKIHQIEQEIATEQRTYTAAINAATYAKNAKEDRNAAEHFKQADRASAKLAALQTDLERAQEPIPLPEGLAAWDENSRVVFREMRTRLHDYLEACNDAGEALVLLLDVYERIHKERIEYAAECCREGTAAEDFQDVLKQFKTATLKEDHIRRSINFYKDLFHVMTAEEARHYKRIL